MGAGKETDFPPCALYPDKHCYLNCLHSVSGPCPRACCICGQEMTDATTMWSDRRGTMHIGCKDALAADDLKHAKRARDLLNRLVDEGKITMHGECFFEEIDQEPWHKVSRLRICRLVPRTVYDEEPLP